jgi:tRNA modification GTPase
MIMKKETSTIFAPATPVGETSILVIRISGKDSFSAIEKIFSKKDDRFTRLDITDINTHTAHHGYIFDGDDMIDEVVITIFKSPNSFTGEDIAEISSHGGRIVFKKISELLSKCGLKHANPGEFSKRAFFNGKIDLTQAEAISDMIKAKTELSFKAAKNQYKGLISNKINILRQELVNFCSLIELEIDFTEEGLEILNKQEFIKRIDNITDILDNLAKSYQTGRVVRDGIKLTIIGNPNAGKSSLFNYLLNDSRAIVSDIPGTTRDYIEEPLILGGFVFNLVDTAGIRKTVNKIEQIGVKKTYKKIEEADIIIKVIDLTNIGDKTRINQNGNTIIVYNKCDLVESRYQDGIAVSAKTGFNIDVLENMIVKKAKGIVQEGLNSEIFITSERHRDLLLKSCEYLVKAKNLVLEGKGNELISIEIREALTALSEIIGKTTNVDILNNIFSKFCIGK